MTALSLLAMTAPLSYPPLLSLLSPLSSSSLIFLLAFALGCVLAIAVSVSRRKGCRLKDEARRRPLAEKVGDDSAVSIVAPECGGDAHHHLGHPEWVPVPSPPPPPLLGGGEGEEKKKKKKRGRKKKQEAHSGAGSDGGEELGCGVKDRVEWSGGKQGADGIYPFSTFSSATQRRIKQQYDQLVKSNQAKALTMAQIHLMGSTTFHLEGLKSTLGSMILVKKEAQLFPCGKSFPFLAFFLHFLMKEHDLFDDPKHEFSSEMLQLQLNYKE